MRRGHQQCVVAITNASWSSTMRRGHQQCRREGKLGPSVLVPLRTANGNALLSSMTPDSKHAVSDNLNFFGGVLTNFISCFLPTIFNR
jgi:hypothetical protein